MIFDVTINTHGTVDICGFSNDRVVRGKLCYKAGVVQVWRRDGWPPWPVEQMNMVSVVHINGGEIEFTGVNDKSEKETWTCKAVMPECGGSQGDSAV